MNNSLHQYYKDLGSISYQETLNKQLFDKLSASYERASIINQLLLNNLRLVVRIVSEFKVPNHLRSDIIQAGNEGLRAAINKYQNKSPFNFAAYASTYIKKYIYQEFRNQNVIKKTKGPKIQTCNIEPLANYLYQEEEKSDFSELHDALLESFENTNLTPLQREILLLKFNFFSQEERNLREIATLLDKNYDYVRKVYKEALFKLKDCEELKQYL